MCSVCYKFNVMDTSLRRGDLGEKKAIEFLVIKKNEILATNYRYKKAEVDIISIDKECVPEIMVFTEVKFRKNNHFGNPEEFVTKAKLKLMKKLAEYYTYRVNWKKDIRFDVIAILGDQILHIKDVV